MWQPHVERVGSATEGSCMMLRVLPTTTSVWRQQQQCFGRGSCSSGEEIAAEQYHATTTPTEDAEGFH